MAFVGVFLLVRRVRGLSLDCRVIFAWDFAGCSQDVRTIRGPAISAGCPWDPRRPVDFRGVV